MRPTGEMVNVVNQEVQTANEPDPTLKTTWTSRLRETVVLRRVSPPVSHPTVPRRGCEHKKGDTITATVSKGPETEHLPVPPFRGSEHGQCPLQAKTTGLTWADRRYESRQPPCRRAASSGRASSPKTEVAPGTEIDTISKGPGRPSHVPTIAVMSPGLPESRSVGNLDGEEPSNTTVVSSATVEYHGPRRRPFRQPYLHR